MKLRPSSWMQLITKYRTSCCLVKSRDLHWGLLATKDHKDINLSSLRMLLVADGANPWSLSSCDQFLSVFSAKGLRSDAICPCASSSEIFTVSLRRPGRTNLAYNTQNTATTGRGVLSMAALSHGVVRVDSEDSLTSLTLQDCGQVMPGASMIVVQPEGAPVLCKTDQVSCCYQLKLEPRKLNLNYSFDSGRWNLRNFWFNRQWLFRSGRTLKFNLQSTPSHWHNTTNTCWPNCYNDIAVFCEGRWAKPEANRRRTVCAKRSVGLFRSWWACVCLWIKGRTDDGHWAETQCGWHHCDGLGCWANAFHLPRSHCRLLNKGSQRRKGLRDCWAATRLQWGRVVPVDVTRATSSWLNSPGWHLLLGISSTKPSTENAARRDSFVRGEKKVPGGFTSSG